MLSLMLKSGCERSRMSLKWPGWDDFGITPNRLIWNSGIEFGSISPTMRPACTTYNLALLLSLPGPRACLISLNDGGISRIGILLKICVECLM